MYFNVLCPDQRAKHDFMPLNAHLVQLWELPSMHCSQSGTRLDGAVCMNFCQVAVGEVKRIRVQAVKDLMHSRGNFIARLWFGICHCTTVLNILIPQGLRKQLVTPSCTIKPVIPIWHVSQRVAHHHSFEWWSSTWPKKFWNVHQKSSKACSMGITLKRQTDPLSFMFCGTIRVFSIGTGSMEHEKCCGVPAMQ